MNFKTNDSQKSKNLTLPFTAIFTEIHELEIQGCQEHLKERSEFKYEFRF